MAASRAEIRLDVLRYAAKRYRELFILSFTYAMDGEADEQARRVRRIFSKTNIEYWLELKARDRMSGALPGQGEADKQLRLWIAAELTRKAA